MVKEQPEGLNFLAEGFPGWDASTRWSQALEDVEQRSRPYLKEVERYERYRCSQALNHVAFLPRFLPSCI